jgi:hypothetical protein
VCKTKQAMQVQRTFHMHYAKVSPSGLTIYAWHSNFSETECCVINSHKRKAVGQL